jgi:predicted ATPase
LSQYFASLLAETLAKDGETGAALEAVGEALGAAERSGERFYTAEHGELLLASGHDRAAAVRCFNTAADIARRQGAYALARRAQRSLEANRV